MVSYLDEEHDVKGMASMVAALEDLSTFETRHASVIFVASVNEEFGFSGAKAFTTLLKTDAIEARLRET